MSEPRPTVETSKRDSPDRPSGSRPTIEPAERDGPDRLTLRLSPEARRALEEISTLRGGVSFAEVVRRALGTEEFLIKEQQEGSRILLERPDKSVRQIVLR